MKDTEIFPAGSLAVVALPLGNSGDVTARALQVLSRADLVAAEDTRTAARILAAHGISRPLISYHDWNEASRAQALLAKLEGGARIALTSEAGTPGISDPGFDLVRAARRQGVRVFPVPGPSAVIAFLCASGLPTDAFTFLGFPPSRPSKRRSFFAELSTRTETLVFYESPQRILAALDDALETLGDREAALGREMTKTYETFHFGTISSIRDELAKAERVRGEICWGARGAGKGAQAEEPDAATLEERLAKALDTGAHVKTLARDLAKETGLSAKDLYARLSALRRGQAP